MNAQMLRKFTFLADVWQIREADSTHMGQNFPKQRISKFCFLVDVWQIRENGSTHTGKNFPESDSISAPQHAELKTFFVQYESKDKEERRAEQALVGDHTYIQAHGAQKM